jgi:hypothetical protein
VEEVRRGQGRHVRGVEGRRDLDEVRGDDVERALLRRVQQRPQDLLGLARREPAGLRRARPRREGGVEHVDVEGQIGRPRDDRRDLRRERRDASRTFPHILLT